MRDLVIGILAAVLAVLAIPLVNYDAWLWVASKFDEPHFVYWIAVVVTLSALGATLWKPSRATTMRKTFGGVTSRGI